MMASVRLGLSAVPAGNVAVLTPVDVLPPRLDTLDQLAEAIEGLGESSLGVRPVMRGKGGHPLVLTPGAIREILADATIDRLDVWVRDAVAEERLADLEVDDYNVVSNLNAPADLP
jgi:CTP:molybdopterin cytidylyltransferase MocA